MAYWWVSQNKTFEQDRKAGFLWTPQIDKGGACPYSWLNLSLVRAGDTLFSYVGRCVVAILTANQDARESHFPQDRSTSLTHGHDDIEVIGWIVDVTFHLLEPKIQVPGIKQQLMEFLPKKYSPLKADGSGALGFVFALPPLAGRYLLDMGANQTLGSTGGIREEAQASAIWESPVPVTERDSLVKSRIGQGIFRESLLKLWGGRCCITGCGIEPLLRASHIKPWCDSNNHERLDPQNGLLLTPALDAAFDRGFISFSDSGGMLLSPMVDRSELNRAGISPDLSISQVTPQQREYLVYHRHNVFLSK